MTARPPLLPVTEAIARIAGAVPSMPGETVAIAGLHGRCLATPLPARVSHPPADVSAMDGYAARADDLGGLPARLRLIGESAAGHPFAGTIGAGECVRIFTGAHCPQGSDTIILQEDTEAEGETITIREAPAKGRFIRKTGNDFTSGDILFEKGQLITARNVALIGAAGYGSAEVRKRPRIAILSTGDELVEPGIIPKDSQIVSSNGIFLENLIRVLGGEPLPSRIVRDDPDALEDALKEASAADLIVTSGGASVGKHDGIANRMQTDRDLDFWRIAMRPGKPLLFGTIGDGAKKTPLIGLPGNPVSTGVCGMIFVAAALNAMLGRDPMPKYQHAVLDHDLPAGDERQDFLRARIRHDDHGRNHAEAFLKQDSGMLAVFARADALIMRPIHAPAAPRGSIVPILPVPAGI
ncbi:gephyrin-like molybdotransferase Glp [Alphaproteobacteria bacterium LSUCC0684]